MATNFTTALHDEGDNTAQARMGSQTVYDRYELTAALIVNDAIRFMYIPKGAVILDAWMTCDDLDTHATPLITQTLQISDDSTDKVFFTASTVGRTGGLQRADEDAAEAIGYEVTTEGFFVELLTAAAPATGTATGTIYVFVSYTMNRINADV